MKKWLLGAAFGAALLSSPISAEANCYKGAFAGPYVGAAIGFGRHDGKQTSPADPDLHGDDGAFTAGGLVGYNLQCSHFVIGAEADINYLGSDVRTSWANPIYLTSSIDWFGTLRGRAGLTVRDDVLLYATAGLAYANRSHKLMDPNPPAGPAPFIQLDKDWDWGWTAGGGIEFLRHERWLFRAEALYVDLGKSHHYYQINGGCAGVCWDTADWRDSFWVGRIGVSLKLGHEEERVSLK